MSFHTQQPPSIRNKTNDESYSHMYAKCLSKHFNQINITRSINSEQPLIEKGLGVAYDVFDIILNP
jgi:hypothetical protein